ncbi:PAS domain S-box protein [Halapricum hydrolyticum]|uniref:histidine kinase n=1 Tax=Halapricum hydrolyticum TaxID=2979991 RepID=A0AAE3IEE0_9EURY|nr:PAS domain S-box protein [Halapricum hydrolyticum]MCU4719447.1 PAS domain S-box protein [Halapricum hydrolyticum]MCU4728456.1 PAS domain S-box protein [Halapricum hydrolyticum]
MGPAGPIRVLYVDDDPHFGELVGTFLEREEDSLRVQTAPDVEEARSTLAERDLDCLVSAYELSDRDGIEFFETIRDDHPGLPFVLFFDRANEAIASEAADTGITEYVRKGGSDQYAVLANRIVNVVSRNRATRRLRMAEKRYRSLFTEMNKGVAFHELVTGDAGEPVDFRILEVNDQYESTLGLDRGDVVGRLASEVYGTVASVYLDRCVSVVRTGESIQFETYYPPLEKHVRISAFSPTDGQLVTVLSDVTEQKRTEARLQESQQTYENVFEGFNDATFVHEMHGKIIAVNGTACERLGYDEESLIGTSLLKFDAVGAPDAGMRDRLETIREEGHVTFETTLDTKTGEGIPVEISSSRIEYFGMPAILSVARDITERKERERQLQTLNERFELALEAGQFGIWDWNVETDEVTFSERWAEMLGHSLAEIEPHADAWEKRVHPDDLPDAWDALEAHFEGETDYYECDHRMRTKSGDWIWIRDIGKVFEWDEAGDPVRMVGIHQDVTERKQRQKELRRQNRRLEEFASVVSHDLRSPLQVASGQVELAREDCDSEHLDRIDDALDRSQVLIDDLLTLAQEGARMSEMEVVELPAPAKDGWHHVETADATLEVETDTTVRADEGRLQQLFENLFRNAVEHGGTDVTVRVGPLGRDGFYVADDGAGIEPDERTDVFESGYSTAEDGTGFGLAIVEEIARAHGWTVDVTDSESGGARFEIGDVAVVE